jgi:hypothetical protein
VPPAAVLSQGLGDAEVAEVSIALLIEEDVVRLDVPVQIALAMNEVESAGNRV